MKRTLVAQFALAAIAAVLLLIVEFGVAILIRLTAWGRNAEPWWWLWYRAAIWTAPAGTHMPDFVGATLLNLLFDWIVSFGFLSLFLRIRNRTRETA